LIYKSQLYNIYSAGKYKTLVVIVSYLVKMIRTKTSPLIQKIQN